MSTFAGTTTRAQLMVVGVLTTGCLVLPGAAQAAPADTSAEGTVQQLESGGYDVIVSRAGNGPLSLCTVAAVRPGQISNSAASPTGDSAWTSHPRRTVYVDLTC